MHSQSDSHGLSRRRFLTTLAAPVVVSACDRLRPDGQPGATVGLFAVDRYSDDLAQVIGRGLTELGIDVRGRRVLLKPNMVEYEPGTSINTHPLVVAGAAVALGRAGAASVAVAEGPGHRRDIEYLLAATGLGDHLRELGAAFTDLNHDDVRVVPLAGGRTGLGQLALPVTVLQSDFIVTMPKLKTHHWAGLTCSMKNLFGVVPGAVYGWPKNVLHIRGIDQSIFDLTATLRPHLAIVDGITAMEGDGPIMGNPRQLGLIAMGTDPVAVDATCARIIGLDPQKVPYLESAGRHLGVVAADRINQRGEPVSRFATSFALIPELQHLKAG